MTKLDPKQLKEFEFFKFCSEEEIKEILGIISVKKVKKREVIFYEGDECQFIYFIVKGIIKVNKTTADGREQIVNMLATSDMFPHIGLFSGGLYPATTIAMEDSTLYALHVEDFKRILEVNPLLSIKLLQNMENKIRALQGRLANIMNNDTTEKVKNMLYSLAKTHGLKIGKEIEIDIEVTHQNIADMLGLTRESVSRIMSQLKKEGTIYYKGNKIRIYKIEKK